MIKAKKTTFAVFYSMWTISELERPNISGLYISSILVGGTMKRPRDVAVIRKEYSYDPGDKCDVNASTRSSRVFV